MTGQRSLYPYDQYGAATTTGCLGCIGGSKKVLAIIGAFCTEGVMRYSLGDTELTGNAIN